YYRAYADAPIRRLARVLGEGFAYQGGPSPLHGGRSALGSPRGAPPCAFVAFLQNHDQIGNRAFGERQRVVVHERAQPLAECAVADLIVVLQERD
ncbi:hypothetical protein ACPYIY_34640, partial [Burkholderia pseudomallei]